MPKTLYLINPRSDGPIFYGRQVFASYGFEPAMLLADLALPTVAAMAPPDFLVTLCEEHVTPADLEIETDFVGITGKAGQESRMIELSREYRRRGKVVIFGGPYATLSPERLRGECDILVRGELEGISETLFADLRNATWKKEYEGDKPDLRDSPLPKWAGYPIGRALHGTVQTSRGCPFECEFCDVIQYLGRKQRHKSTSQVIRELDQLYDLGYRAIFLADDNFTVYRARAKELLTALADWNGSRTLGRVAFSTQLSIECSKDIEMLDLCAAAGMFSVFIGIETTNSESLKETKKRQNLGIDLVERVERFVARGIRVDAGMIVGFDADRKDAFKRQYEFAMSAPVPIFSVASLSAPPATPLYARLAAENRLIAIGSDTPQTSALTTNIVPRHMTNAELIRGMSWLVTRLYSADAFGTRLLRFIDCYQQPTGISNAGSSRAPVRPIEIEHVQIAGRVLRLGLAEEAMIARLSRRIQTKPFITGQVLALLGQYMQARYVYREAGLWDPQLAAQPDPFMNDAVQPVAVGNTCAAAGSSAASPINVN
jgi:radical SAM superfamily enzyme YgiQ (UPF0313 family)